MTKTRSTLKVLLGVGLAAGAAFTVLALTPKGKDVRKQVQKKVRKGSRTLREMRKPANRHFREHA